MKNKLYFNPPTKHSYDGSKMPKYYTDELGQMTQINNMTEQQILQEAINRYGQMAQIEMLVEEASEVIQAVQKRKRALLNREAGLEYGEKLGKANSELIDELADLEIMLDQMKLIFNPEAILRRREFKINRLKERLGL